MERSADGRIRTTEWEDIQYRYGNRVGKYATDELSLLAQSIADKNKDACLNVYDPHEEKVQDKLQRGGYECKEGREGDEQAIVDSDDEDDALAAIRRKRLLELQAQKEVERFGVLRHVPGADYVKEVTESSERNWVVALLVKPGHSDCEALLTVMRVVAQRNRDVKFVSMVSTEAIANFPDKHLPCVLLYNKKTLADRVTELAPWKAKGQMGVDTVERVLSHYGVVKRDDVLDNDDGE